MPNARQQTGRYLPTLDLGDKQRCFCVACGAYFTSYVGFDRHRTGDYVDVPPAYGRRCLDAAEMAEKGMKQNAAGYWVGRPAQEGRFWPAPSA